MLFEVTDGVVFGKGNGALIRLLLPRQQAKQGGLAVTVPADQTDPFAGVDAEIGTGKKDLLPVGFGKIDCCDQRYHLKGLINTLNLYVGEQIVKGW